MRLGHDDMGGNGVERCASGEVRIGDCAVRARLRTGRSANGLQCSWCQIVDAPGVDFFDHANGGYLDHLQIPLDEPEFGVIDELDQLSRLRVRAILEEAAARTSGSALRNAMNARNAAD